MNRNKINRTAVGRVFRVGGLLVAAVIVGLAMRGLGHAVGLAVDVGSASPLLTAVFDAGALLSATLAAWIVLKTPQLNDVTWSLLAYLLGVSGAVVLLLDTSAGGSVVWQWNRWFWVTTAGLVGSTGLARFSVLFPRPLTPEDLQPVSQSPGFRRAVVFLQSSWLPFVTAIAVVAAAAGSLLARPSAVEVAETLAFVVVALCPMTGVVAAGLVEVSYAARGEHDRRKLLWIRWGFYGGVLSLLAALSSMAAGAPLLVTGTLSSLPLALLSIGLSVAVFYQGAIDPGHAIKKTTVYGVLGTLFVFVFAGLGNVVSEAIESMLGLPGTVGTLLYGGTVAVLLIPVRNRLNRITDRWQFAQDSERVDGSEAT